MIPKTKFPIPASLAPENPAEVVLGKVTGRANLAHLLGDAARLHAPRQSGIAEEEHNPVAVRPRPV